MSEVCRCRRSCGSTATTPPSSASATRCRCGRAGPTGPFDHWPAFSGFEKFYGFIGGETNQWTPALIDGVDFDRAADDPDYHLMPDLADKTIQYINQQKALTPDKPFFIYFAPGATHAPHHVPKDWIAKHKGKYDQGWDKLREETFDRQKALGVIPADAVLTERSEGIPAWDEYRRGQAPILAHQMEVYGAFLEYADHHTGRVVDALEGLGHPRRHPRVVHHRRQRRRRPRAG